MVGEIAGRMADGQPGGDRCDLDGIANPDNLTFIPGQRTLIVGEDTTEGHRNDAVWAYNLDTKALTRIQTTPYGAETTSVYFYPNINGFGYLMSVVQHPYGESDQDKLIPGSGDERGYTGYIGPFPAM
jgi:secreted PhoX family phosphatase